MKDKAIKTFEGFVVNKNFKFEESVIDVILNLIKDNQVYLTKKENLPQLAKLGYMYNTLWYSGRLCWGYSGKLRGTKLVMNAGTDDEYEYGDCEDNPKYKIEMCNPQSDEIESYIYDAWGMHVTDGISSPDFKTFFDKIKNGKVLSDLDKKILKLNKTFEDWVEILTDKRYKYNSIYPDKRSVANHLLCTIGSGYGINKDGFIYNEASGADQDEADYGDWENAKFRDDIQKSVDNILSIPEVKATLDTTYKFNQKLLDKKKKEEREQNDLFYDILRDSGLYKDDEGDLPWSEIYKRLQKSREGTPLGKDFLNYQKEYSYYPICSSSKIYIIGDKESQDRLGIQKIDQSYIDASIEICKDILKNEKVESKNADNVGFAKEFLGKFGVEEYKTFVKKSIDKYEVLNAIKECFSEFSDNFGTEVEQSEVYDSNSNVWSIKLSDTRYNEYGDNNYYITIGFGNKSSLPKGASTDVDFLKSMPFFTSLKSALQKIEKADSWVDADIKYVRFLYDNIDNPIAHINIIVNDDRNTKDEILSESNFVKNGFMVGNNNLIMKLDKLGVNLLTRKPEPLGSTHPDNKTGKEYFSQSKPLQITDLNYTKIFASNIDERGYNTLTLNNQKGVNKPLHDWIVKEFDAMKLSNPSYGTYGKSKKGSEGRLSLYVHDFMLWLYKNQSNFKK